MKTRWAGPLTEENPILLSEERLKRLDILLAGREVLRDERGTFHMFHPFFSGAFSVVLFVGCFFFVWLLCFLLWHLKVLRSFY